MRPLRVHYASPGHLHAWCGTYTGRRRTTTVLSEVTCQRCLRASNPSPRYLMERP